MTLTPAQQEAADAIVAMNVDFGRPPTISELADVLGIGNTATFARLSRLRAAGFLRDDDRISLGDGGLLLLSDAIRETIRLGPNL